MATIDDALALLEKGWSVFPCRQDKRPATTHGFKDSSADEAVVRAWWTEDPTYLIGLDIPMDVLVADIDDWDKFSATGLDLPETFMQQTRSGGWHAFYRLPDGPRPKQQIKRHPGVDTRVGGAGYIIAWEPDQVPPTDADLPTAPLWSVEAEPPKAAQASSDEDFWLNGEGFTTRAEMLRMAGNMRHVGLGWEEIVQVFVQARALDKIVDGDPARPWTNKDFIQIAQETAKWEPAQLVPEFSVKRAEKKSGKGEVPDTRVFADELVQMDFPPLTYMIDTIMPEGLGIVAGAPKMGKSWMCLQAGIAVSAGHDMLGFKVPVRRPVLYYALEDSQRRTSSRIQQLIGMQRVDLSWLEIRWEARPMGAGFEDDVTRWLDDNADLGPALIIVDVLAKVRPVAKGKDNAYNEEYIMMKGTQDVLRHRPGSCLAYVTHTRKADAKDFLSTIQGTHALVGSSDWTWKIDRDRHQPEGRLEITGRDVLEQELDVIHSGSAWVRGLSGGQRPESPEQERVYELLLTEGDLTVYEIVDHLYDDLDVFAPDPSAETIKAVHNKRNEIGKLLAKLRERHFAQVVGKHGQEAIWHGNSDAERSASIDAAKASAKQRANVLAPAITVVRT